MRFCEKNPGHCDYDETQYAALGTNGSPAEPIRPTQRRTEQMAGRKHPAIGNGVKEAFAPIPCGVEAHREPQAPSSPQGEAEKQTDTGGGEQPWPLLASIPQVNRSECGRQGNRGTPKADPSRQGELGIATEQERLEQADQQKKTRPESGKADQTHSMDRKMTEGEGIEPIERDHQQGDPSESPDGAAPKSSSQGLLCWQPIHAPATTLDSRQHDGRDNGGNEISQFFDRIRPQAACAGLDRPGQSQLQEVKQEGIDHQSPPWPQAIG